MCLLKYNIDIIEEINFINDEIVYSGCSGKVRIRVRSSCVGFFCLK